MAKAYGIPRSHVLDRRKVVVVKTTACLLRCIARHTLVAVASRGSVSAHRVSQMQAGPYHEQPGTRLLALLMTYKVRA